MKTKHLAGIGAGVAIVAIIVTLSFIMPQEIEQQPAIISPTNELVSTLQNTILNTAQKTKYRFNTDCELYYGQTFNVYPNGEQLPELILSHIVEKYPQDYVQWNDILYNEERRLEYFKDDMPFEFAKVFATSIMKEYSINPELFSIVLLTFTEQNTEITDDFLKQSGCDDYFENRLQLEK